MPIVPTGTMPMRRFGKTGVDISRLGFGSHLDEACKADPKTRDRMIRMGYEGGINFFDIYDREEYKQYIPMGKSIRDFRKDIHLSLYAINGLDRMQSDIDSALRALKTDYIDFYRFRPVNDDTMAVMEQNRQAGKIRFIGIASHSAGQLNDTLDTYGSVLDYCLLIYNFHHNRLTPGPQHTPNEYSMIFPKARDLDLGVVVIKPLGSDNLIHFAEREGYCADCNVAQAALRYVYEQENVHCVLTAMNTPQEVADNLGSAYQPTLSDRERTVLAEVSTAAQAQNRAYLPGHYKWLENWAMPHYMG
jgi:predicted aldo/keto reductase-like oxidoreductase